MAGIGSTDPSTGKVCDTTTITCARNSPAIVPESRIGWIFAAGAAIRFSGQAASGPARAKGRALAKGRARASDRRAAGPARDNNLQRENPAPSGRQAGSGLMHWATSGPAELPIGHRRVVVPASEVVASVAEAYAAAAVSAVAVASVAAAVVVAAAGGAEVVVDDPISRSSTISFCSAIFPTGSATIASATTVATAP